MSATVVRRVRGLAAAVLLSVGLLAAAAPGAGATISATQISSPASPWRYQYNQNAPSPVTIAGTADSTDPATDTVDLNCYYSSAGSLTFLPIASAVPLANDGAFAWTGTVNETGWSCQLRAVPHGYGIAYPLSPFAPVYSELDTTKLTPVSGPVAGAAPPFQDFYYTASGPSAFADYDSVGNCGLEYTYVISSAQDQNSAHATWNCAAALYGDDGSGARTEILIDGRNAYDAFGAAKAYTDSGLHEGSGQAAGYPGLIASYSKNPVTGDVTIREGEPLVSCADTSYPATEVKCGGSPGHSLGAWQADGVTFTRTILQTDGGQLVIVTDTYSSSDGHPHGLDLEYDNYVDEQSEPVFWLPGTSGFESYAIGDTSGLSGRSADVIYTRDGYYPDANPYDSPGALIYETQPNDIAFTFANHGPANEFVLDYQREVPAGGSIAITQSYVTAADQAGVQRIANGVLDQTYRPAVAISSPANGFVTRDGWLQVSGTASAHDGLGLRVNGEAVGVNPDGSWSTALALHRGANRITAIASDGSGNSAQAAETVVYAPAAVPALCIVPRVRGKTLAGAKAALRRAHCAVGRVAKVRSRAVRRGRVEHASASPGTVFGAGRRIGLTESTGAPRRPGHHRPAPRHGARRALGGRADHLA